MSRTKIKKDINYTKTSSIKQQAKPSKIGINLSAGITLAEQLAEIREELKNHKDAIKFLLYNSKQFQDEISKEKQKTQK